MGKHIRSVCTVAAVVVVSALVLVGCGATKPSVVAERFFNALASGDMETAGKYATPGTAITIAAAGSKLQVAAKMKGKVKRSTEEISGDQATVTLYFENGEEDEFELVKIDGKWKVDINTDSGGK